MNIQKIKYIIFFILFTVSASAQFDLIMPDLQAHKYVFKDAIKKGDNYFMANFNRSGFVHTIKHNMLFIKYDQNLDEVKRYKTKLKDGERRVKFVKYLIVNEVLYGLCYSIDDKKNKKIFLLQIDEQTLELSNSKIIIDALGNSNFKNPSNIFVEQSANKKYTLILAAYKGKGKKPRGFQAIVLNEQLEEVLNKHVEFEKSNKKLILSEYEVEDDGSVFIMGFQRKESIGYLWRHLATTGESFFDEIQSTQLWTFKSIDFSIHNNDIIIAGTYSRYKDDDERSARGLYFLTQSKYKKISNEAFVFSPLPYSVLHHRLSKSKQKKLLKKKQVKEFFRLHISKIALWKRDRYIIVCEGYPLGDVYVAAEYTPLFKDAVVSCLNSKGEMIWSVPIKKQRKMDGWNNHHSYLMALTDSEVHILYNNDRKSEMPFYGFVSTSIDEKGKSYSNLIFSKDSEQVLVSPTYCRVFDDEFFLFCRNLYRYNVGVLKYN